MKRTILYKMVRLTCAMLFLSFIACTSDDGPSIDDYFLNYEIPVIDPDSDIPVGVFYYNLGTNGMDIAKYNRLLGEYDPSATPWPQLCSNVRPVLGRYKMDIGSNETIDLFQQHLDWANNAKINFLILPNIREDRNQPNHLNKGNVDFVNYMAGYHERSYERMNWGNLRYVVSMTMDDFTDGLSSSNMIEDADVDDEGVSQRCERIYNFFKGLSERFFENDDLYYKVDDKPMIVIYNPQKLYSKNSEQLYQNMRDTVYKYAKTEIYMVARQDRWTPPARFHNFFLTGKVDAVYMDNMYDQIDFTRSYMYPQMINENFQYNREYHWANYGVDFIPSVAPSFNTWINGTGTDRYNYPLVFKDEAVFRTMCNVAKMNLGNRRMVFIDSFNRWDSDMALEPTDPGYGNGYGMKYLDIVREEFKIR